MYEIPSSSSLLSWITCDQALGNFVSTVTRLITRKVGMWLLSICNRLLSSWSRNKLTFRPWYNMITDTRMDFSGERIHCLPKKKDQKTEMISNWNKPREMKNKGNYPHNSGMQIFLAKKQRSSESEWSGLALYNQPR